MWIKKGLLLLVQYRNISTIVAMITITAITTKSSTIANADSENAPLSLPILIIM